MFVCLLISAVIFAPFISSFSLPSRSEDPGVIIPDRKIKFERCTAVFFFLLFARFFYFVRASSFSFSLPNRNAGPGGVTEQVLLPRPEDGVRLYFCREKSLAFYPVSSNTW